MPLTDTTNAPAANAPRRHAKQTLQRRPSMEDVLATKLDAKPGRARRGSAGTTAGAQRRGPLQLLLGVGPRATSRAVYVVLTQIGTLELYSKKKQFGKTGAEATCYVPACTVAADGAELKLSQSGSVAFAFACQAQAEAAAWAEALSAFIVEDEPAPAAAPVVVAAPVVAAAPKAPTAVAVVLSPAGPYEQRVMASLVVVKARLSRRQKDCDLEALTAAAVERAFTYEEFAVPKRRGWLSCFKRQTVLQQSLL